MFKNIEIEKTGNYSLLILVMFLLFVVPFFPIAAQTSIYTITFTIIFFTLALTTGTHYKKVITISIILTVTEWLASALGLKFIQIISLVGNILFFYAIVGMLIYKVAKRKEVTGLVIIESINGYLLLGLAFTTLVMLLSLLNPGAFSFPDVPKDEMRHIMIYYTYVTISTLGYGDILPTTPGARSIATFISLSGQIYIAVIIAMLVGKFASQNDK